MNKSIRAVTIFSFVLFVALLINFTWLQGFTRSELAENPLDRRPYLAEKSQQRGQISAGGQVLANSVKGDDGFYQREYQTNPEIFSSLTGYLSDQFGASGIEASYNTILNGTDETLFASRAMDFFSGREQLGANVELTIDPIVQEVAYNQLASSGYTGSVVAIRPSTGEIIAMANTPSFNSQDIAQPDSEAASSYFDSLSEDPDAPLLNRSSQQTQPPGSTFKLITTAAALANGATPDDQVTAAAQITLPDTVTTLENYDGQACAGSATVSLMEAFARSCNTAFAQLANEYGIDAFKEMASNFGIGSDTTDLGIPVETSQVGDIPDSAALAQSAIGQRDVRLTPLQNASIAATIANAGVRMDPHMVKKVTGSSLQTLNETEPATLNQAIEPDVARTLTEMMMESERNSIGGYNGIASKTGTAEHGEDSRNSNPHAWYVAFAPTDHADIAVAVLVENGGTSGTAATGGAVAGPIGRAVIEAALARTQAQ